MKKNRELNFDIKQVRSFLEVLNENSFTRASRRLKVGQATISHHIALLEKAFGVKLINRTARDVSATGEGTIFRAFCEKLLKSVESLAADLGRGAAAGAVRIAASTVPAGYILPRICASLAEKFPAMTFRLEVTDSREAVEMVKEGRADIGIVGKEYKNPLLEYTPVCRDEIVLVGAGRFPARVAVKDLTGMPFIIREAGSGTRRNYEEALSRHGITPSALQAVLECTSMEGIKEAVAAGLGVSFMSRLAVSREVRMKMLKIIEIKGLAIPRYFYFVHPASRTLSAPAGLILKSLLELQKKSGDGRERTSRTERPREK
ncbi:MAG: LysR family transcriptional regulator [Spirochaetes bacterium]|nr:LysR family transcriptional regulator [Spirochaetota bacterium]